MQDRPSIQGRKARILKAQLVRVHQSIPQRPPDTNTILEISLVLLSYDQGSSQSITTHATLCLTPL